MAMQGAPAPVLVLVVAVLIAAASLAGLDTEGGGVRVLSEPPLAFAPVEPPETPDAGTPRDAMRFGIDKDGAQAAGADLGVIWIGPWNQVHGWLGPKNDTARLLEQNITPAYQLYYWGDDMSRSCFENGCWSDLHGVYKDQWGWNALVERFVRFLNEDAPGKEVYVFLETEFNRHGVRDYEPLDKALADHARDIKDGHDGARVYLALGNWNPADWPTWDRAAAASDGVGIQGVRGATHDDVEDFDDLYEQTLSGARTANRLFDRPVVVDDIAVSSYPGGDMEAVQARTLSEFFSGIGQLKDAGVQVVVYRAWEDQPTADPGNTYGAAERAWGLNHADGRAKPAAATWNEGVAQERRQPS